MSIKVNFYDAKGDLSKPWFISITSPKRRRVRIYAKINSYKTASGRHRCINQTIKELNLMIEAGVDPWSKNFTLIEKKPARKTSFEKDINSLFDSSVYRKKSRQSLQSIFDSFIEYLKLVKVHNFRHVTTLNCLNYSDYLLKKRGNCQQTANNHLVKIKQLFSFLVERGQIKKNPLDGHKLKKVETDGVLPFKDFQRKLLKISIQEKTPDLWLFIQFIFYLFIRPGELRFMRINLIDLGNGTITIPADIAKNKKTQTIVIPDCMIETVFNLKLHEYDPHFFVFTAMGTPGPKQCGVNTMYNRHKIILKEKGITGKYSLYSWKGTGAVAAVKAGINLKEIKEQLRHSSLDMTDKYLKKQGFIEMDDIRRNFPSI
jgi:integrase